MQFILYSVWHSGSKDAILRILVTRNADSTVTAMLLWNSLSSDFFLPKWGNLHKTLIYPNASVCQILEPSCWILHPRQCEEFSYSSKTPLLRHEPGTFKVRHLCHKTQRKTETSQASAYTISGSPLSWRSFVLNPDHTHDNVRCV